MSLRKILIIGVGSFGGFLCKHLSELESVKELFIVDYDFVEPKNARSSIYSISQVGEYKVDALKEIIQDDVLVKEFKAKYEEGKTKLPKVDLVIDCRDIVCDRANEIDMRLYISGKILVIDCRKNIKCHQEYEGSYSINLSKSEIRRAAFFAAQVIDSQQMSNLLHNRLIQTVDLNVLPDIIHKSIKETLENKSDLLYEVFDQTDRIHGLQENIAPIMKINKINDVRVVIGEKPKGILNLPTFAETKNSIIERGSLKTSTDLVETLTNLVKQKGDFMNFIVLVKEGHDGKPYIELLEETGGS